MYGRAETIVGPARDHVAEVDDERACDGGSVYPLALGLALNLEAADLILKKGESHEVEEVALRRL